MKPENQLFLKSFLLTGLIGAGLMAGDDYASGEALSVWKFLFRFLFIGLVIGLLSRYTFKKQE